MKQGTLVVVPGRGVATVVYHFLDGYGVAWGHHAGNEEADFPAPEAMLRNPYPSADIECVGEEFEVLNQAPSPTGQEESE